MHAGARGRDKRPQPERLNPLAAIGERVQFLVLSAYEDAEHDEGDPVEVAVSATLRDGTVVRVVRATSEEAVLAAIGLEQKSHCPKCGEAKPPGEFARNGSITRGRVYRCKACERKRVAEYQRKRRATRGPAGTAAPATTP